MVMILSKMDDNNNNQTDTTTTITVIVSTSVSVASENHDNSNDNTVYIISVSLILGILTCMTIIGNVFVIAAIILERNLRTTANYLVLSLAVADLMVACFVMPLGAVTEIRQQWLLGTLLCDIWTSADVLCCTASILHLLAIALDRYWAVTYVDYIHKRTPHRICLMIFTVWTVAVIVCIAPFFGWKDPDFNIRVEEQKRCLISQDIGYQVFATIATFYGPVIFILLLYWKIYQVARKRIRHKPGKTTIAPAASCINSKIMMIHNDPHSDISPSIIINNSNNNNDAKTNNNTKNNKKLSFRSKIFSPKRLSTPGLKYGLSSVSSASHIDDEERQNSSTISQEERGSGDSNPISSSISNNTNDNNKCLHELNASELYRDVDDDHDHRSLSIDGQKHINNNSNSRNDNNQQQQQEKQNQISLMKNCRNQLHRNITNSSTTTTTTADDNDGNVNDDYGDADGTSTSNETTIIIGQQESTQNKVPKQPQQQNASTQTITPPPSPSSENLLPPTVPSKAIKKAIFNDNNNNDNYSNRNDIPPSTEVFNVENTTSKQQQIVVVTNQRNISTTRTTNSNSLASSQIQFHHQQKKHHQQQSSSSSSPPNIPTISNSQTQYLNEVQMRRAIKESIESKRERKAAKILAIITGIFVICWLPFFVMALLMPLCEICQPSKLTFSTFLWLGYCNSLLNPIIYTIFSPDFRNGFRRILCGKKRR